MMKKALLVIGDSNPRKPKQDPSFNNFVKRIKATKSKRHTPYIISYKDVKSKNLPQIPEANIDIIFFFPFEYWDNNIEVYQKDGRIYGDENFGRDFKKFFDLVEKTIKNKYRRKKIKYVNPPSSSVLERDKKKAKEFFAKNDIPTAKSYALKSLDSIKKITSRGLSLYIKPRFGAMGKGITYVDGDTVVTNYLFRKGKLVSRKYDYNWRFSKIKKNAQEKFLKNFLSQNVIWEEAIKPPVYRKRRFDFRVYCIYGKVPYFYARSAPADSCVTNWSQGGRIDKKGTILKHLSADQKRRVKSLALNVAKRLNLNYAGVDIIFSDDFKSAYVLEAHSFPGYEKGYDLMDYLVKEMLKS